MSSGNGNGWKNARNEVLSFLGGEAGGVAVGIGAFTFMDEIAPGPMKWVSKKIGKICVEPFIDIIERGLQKITKSKDLQPDFNKPRAERAEEYAHYIMRYGISAGLGFGTEYLIRKGLNSKYALNVEDPVGAGKVTKFDKVLEVGLIGLVNTVGASQADKTIEATSKMMQKNLGWEEDRADRFADVTIRFEAGKWAAAMLTSGYIFTRQLFMRGR